MEEEEFLIEFSERLKKIRFTLNISQTVFSRQLHVSPSTYLRYETAYMSPKVQVLSLLIEKFNVNIEWLLTGKGNMFLPKKEIILPDNIKEILKDKRYLELLELMEIPEVERAIIAKLDEVKRIFKNDIEEFKMQKKRGT